MAECAAVHYDLACLFQRLGIGRLVEGLEAVDFGIKSVYSPLFTCADSYQINSNVALIMKRVGEPPATVNQAH